MKFTMQRTMNGEIYTLFVGDFFIVGLSTQI